MICYVILRFLRIRHPELPSFVKFQLTDLIFVPAMSTFALVFTRLIKRDQSLLIPKLTILLLVICMSFLFEWYLPTYGYADNIYTADYLDVVMYGLGGLIYLFVQERYFKQSGK